jgi:phosphate transport system ATP-binding protein
VTDVFVPQPQSSENHRAATPAESGSANAGLERTGEVPVVEATRAVPTLIGGSPAGAATLEARDACAWFGDHLALEGVFLTMEAGRVTALIGPSGCGKSTFLRLLNRMHELVPGSAMAGEIFLDGDDIYGANMRAQVIRTRIGMVFQKPNPFPAMSIRENVLAGLKLTKIRCSDHDGLVEQSLQRAGLWREVRERLSSPGGALSGGQQQRLCIARSLAVAPNVLLMDEPCSALDPTSTRRIEETIAELRQDVTVVIVTHNMQQAQRVSDHCAFFLAAENEPGRLVEQGSTEKMFGDPDDPRTLDYVHGRFG